MKPFNAIVIGAFFVFALIAVAVIATLSGGGGDTIGNVEVWGSVPGEVVGKHIENVTVSRDDFGGVAYTAMPEATFISELVEAIAANRGPDLIVFPLSYLVAHNDKLEVIPYSSVSRRDFQDTYIEAGEVLLGESGVRGIPYIVDPLVLYWNRTLFSQASLARPPKYWDEVSQMSLQLSRSDENGSLAQSAVALGEWDNVLHGKEIILSLLRQLGNPVVTYTEGEFVNVLTETNGAPIAPAESVFRYYTEFADPVKQVYSWNRSQPSSRDAFLSGTLALYIGFASELPSLRVANPNLNFDVAHLPLARGAGTDVAATLYALAVPRGSQNPSGALSVAFILSGAEAQQLLINETQLPSVRRDLLGVSPEDPYAGIFRDAALNAFVFLDPNPEASESIFGTAVENISSGRLRIHEAVIAADEELQELLRVR